MHVANSNWTLPPSLPDDPKRLCIVEVHHTRINRRRFELLHWARSDWKFQDNTTLSNQAQVLRWAYLDL